MALLKGIGMRFSELRDNHEPAPYWVWSRRDVRTYTRFGVGRTEEGWQKLRRCELPLICPLSQFMSMQLDGIVGGTVW
jgi:hypothetical protein